jgi:hypothetical protein
MTVFLVNNWESFENALQSFSDELSQRNAQTLRLTHSLMS